VVCTRARFGSDIRLAVREAADFHRSLFRANPWMSDQSLTPASRRSDRTIAFSLFACVLLAHFVLALQGWHSPRLIRHEFRQTHTALSTYFLQQDGLRLDYPTPVLGKPWSVPMEFPLYEGLVAKTAEWTGWALEPTGRGIALLFFYAALPALARLLTDWGVTGVRRWLALTFVVSAPVYLFYSRSFLIESTALCFALWFLAGFQRFTSTGKTGPLVLALLTGAIAATVKVTTFAMVGLPAALWLVALRRPRTEGKTLKWPVVLGRAALAATLPIAAGGIWIFYSDGVKSHNALAGFIQSGGVIAWNFGTLAQRFSGDYWQALFTNTLETTIAPAAWLLILPLVAFATRNGGWRHLALALLCFAVGPLVFANLYAVHDYYFYAAGLFLLVGLGVAAGNILEHAPLGGAARWVLIAALLAAQFLQHARIYLPCQREDAEPQPVEAEVLRTVTGPHDVIVVVGRDWNPALPYLARRRALMLPTGQEAEPPVVARALVALRGERIGAFLITGKFRRNQALVDAVLAAGNLARTPVADFEGNALYVPADGVDGARAALGTLVATGRLHGSALVVAAPPPPPPPAPPPPAKPVTPPPVDPNAKPVWSAVPPPPATEDPFSMMSPRPARLAFAHEAAAFNVEGAWSVSAHPPSELEFQLPAGAHQITAEFVMSPGSYTGGGDTDGVEFEFTLQNPGGAPTVVFYRYLQPLTVPADRGPQRAEIALDARPGAVVIARTKPGPAGHANFDWAFWRRIEIK